MTADKRVYQRITGQARAACLSGKFFSSLFAQSVSFINGSVPYVELVYLSIFGKYFVKLKINNFLFLKLRKNINNIKITHKIFQIILSGMFFTAVWAFLMPTVTNSVYFHNEASTSQPSTSTPNQASTSQESKQPAAIETKEKVIEYWNITN